MKNEPFLENMRGLPDERQLCEMILQLPEPYQVMAWLMVETGLRIRDVTSLAVRQFSGAKRQLVVEEGAEVRRISLSKGLVSALTDHVSRIRPAYEGQGRGLFRIARLNRVEHPVRFADSLLYPAWAVAGYEKVSGNLEIPSSWFVDALSHAAQDAGFNGVIHSNTLRHACVTRWINQGLGVAEIHDLLGHRDLMTSMLLVQALQHGGLTFTTAA